MSIEAWTRDLLSLDDWDRLPEDNSRHYELEEGTLRVSPRPVPRHQRVVAKLGHLLSDQLPAHLVALPEIEIVVFDREPPTVRVPDLVVVPKRLLGSDLARYRAQDLRLAVEVLSPGSVRVDQVTKFYEYVEAGIPNYWMIDITGREPELTAYRLDREDYYVLVEKTTERTELTIPAPLTINPAELLP